MKLLTFRLLSCGFLWVISSDIHLLASSSPFTKSISIPFANPESNAPLVSIDYPTNNERVADSIIKTLISASDDTRVESFRFTVNGVQGDWIWAPGMQWPWGASMMLRPGQNTFEVLCADYWGNMASASVTFEYGTGTAAATASGLTLNVGSGGEVTPNLQGQALTPGQKYSMRAHPAKGFRFEGWSGSLSSKKPKLTFVMEPPMSVTASFRDVKRPVDIVTFRKARNATKSTSLIATGKASDNSAVTNVYYQLNGAGWESAITTNSWRNWETVELSPVTGKNVLESFALDDSGLASRTNRMKFRF